MLYGALVLSPGQRRNQLQLALTAIFNEDLAGRVLPFDNPAADSYAQLAAAHKHNGHPISQPDAMIAAIARSRDARIATRNTKDFVDCELTLIDPWR